MLDKLGVVVLIVTFLSGLMVYDRYMTAHGEPSPLAKVLDYTGFSRFVSPEMLGVKKTRKSLSVSFEALHKKLAQIQLKRSELILHRQEILQQLMRINREMQQDAVAVYQALDKEKQGLLIHEQEIKAGQQQLDQEMRQSPSQEVYLKQKVQQVVDPIQKKLLEFQEQDKQVNREYQVFRENSVATEMEIQEGLDNTSAQARGLVQQLVNVTEQDLRDLMELYKELAHIQKILMDNMDLNYQRLTDARQQAQEKQQGILDKLQLEEREIFTSLSQRYQVLADADRALFRDFSDNESQLRELWQAVFSECQDFVASYKQGEILATRDEVVPAALRAKRPVMPSATAEETINSAARQRLNSPDRKPAEYFAAKSNSVPRPSLDEQMRPIKEKAIDQGAYKAQSGQ